MSKTLKNPEQPRIEHKLVNTGYGLAYEGTDATFVPIEKVRINLANPRYSLSPTISKSQTEALDNMTDLQDVGKLRNSIKDIGLQVPLRVVREGDGYKVVDGNRRRAALNLLSLETGNFTKIPVYVLPDMTEDQLDIYLLQLHGANAQKNWPTIIRWMVPYRYYRVLKYSIADISRMTGISKAKLTDYMVAMDRLHEYYSWLESEKKTDPRREKRLSFFYHAGGYVAFKQLFEANKPKFYELLLNGKLDYSRPTMLNLLPMIWDNPSLKNLLYNQGLDTAAASIKAIKGFATT